MKESALLNCSESDTFLMNYTEKEWGKAANYTICLNSSELGEEKTIEIILSCIRR